MLDYTEPTFNKLIQQFGTFPENLRVDRLYVNDNRDCFCQITYLNEKDVETQARKKYNYIKQTIGKNADYDELKQSLSHETEFINMIGIIDNSLFLEPELGTNIYIGLAIAKDLLNILTYDRIVYMCDIMDDNKKGWVLTNESTVFLKEISELSEVEQKKLERAFDGLRSGKIQSSELDLTNKLMLSAEEEFMTYGGVVSEIHGSVLYTDELSNKKIPVVAVRTDEGQTELLPIRNETQELREGQRVVVEIVVEKTRIPYLKRDIVRVFDEELYEKNKCMLDRNRYERERERYQHQNDPYQTAKHLK